MDRMKRIKTSENLQEAVSEEKNVKNKEYQEYNMHSSRERRSPTYSSLWRNRHLILIFMLGGGSLRAGVNNSSENKTTLRIQEKKNN